MAKGSISVNSENIFPIIKKWLYSDKDIFLRELVSNACDAITKLKKLSGIGEVKLSENENFRVTVTVDKEAGKLIISDNGIGMTAEEVDKYITQIAFSGASDFLEKYKDEEKGTQIIGHFGLGFYSAFMPSERVEIDTLSYKEGAKAAYWSCDGGMEYELEVGKRTERGTTITLTIAEDSKEFLDEFTVRAVLSKYCAFLPVEIYVTTPEADSCECDEEECSCEHGEHPINDVSPLWVKAPKDCTEEEYKEFYTKVFADFTPPLFWIHLNVDFPFNLKGILYFPKIHHEFSGHEGQIKLYNNQVFVADNVKEVIPEFLMLLKGVIDCPDLPLNVSRSFLQNDGYVKKISAHITKKVADKLCELFKNEREAFDTYWEDIHVFIKYGCINDAKFYEKVKDIIIYRNLDGKYITLPEYLEAKAGEKTVYYVSDENVQSQYINMLKSEGRDALIMQTMMDTHFISFLESKDNDIKFKRVDSAISESVTENGNGENDELITGLFKETVADESIKIEVQSLKNVSIPAIMLLSEESRRMQEIYRSYGQQFAGMRDMFKDELTLVVNRENSIVKKLAESDETTRKLICEQIYDMASLCHKPLSPERMTAFIARTNELIEKSL